MSAINTTPTPAPFASHNLPAPREVVRIISTHERARLLFPHTGRCDYAVGVVTVYRVHNGPEQRVAHVAVGKNYDEASRAAGSERYCWLEALRRSLR